MAITRELCEQIVNDFVNEDVYPRGNRSPVARLTAALDKIRFKAGYRYREAEKQAEDDPNSASKAKKLRDISGPNSKRFTPAENKAFSKIAGLREYIRNHPDFKYNVDKAPPEELSFKKSKPEDVDNFF